MPKPEDKNDSEPARVNINRDKTKWRETVAKDKQRSRDKRGKAMLREYMLQDE